MDSREFIWKVKRLHATRQVVALKFKKDGIVGLYRLNALTKRVEAPHPTVIIEDKDVIVVAAILHSNDWGHDSNRTISTRGLPQIDDETLANIARDVESVVQPDHFAKGLVSSRTAKRKEACDKLVQAVLQVGEVEAGEWDLELTHSILTEYAGPTDVSVIQFTLFNDEEIVRTVSIDGWSGRFIIDGELNGVCDNLDYFKAMISSEITYIADKLTAA